MAEMHAFKKRDIENLLNNCLGKTLGQVDVNHVFDRTKMNPKITGIAGDVVEQSVFGYSPDQDQRPDLIVDGTPTELKTTGLRKSKSDLKTLEAKEPMSITAVSPETIEMEEFHTSHFWEKLTHLLIVYYLYDSETTVTAAEYAGFPIVGYDFHKFSLADEQILEQDWTIVRDFIRELQSYYCPAESQYHRISSELRSKLLYIDTAPKWPHRPRFRLKRSVVTTMWEKCCGKSFGQVYINAGSYAELDGECNRIASHYRYYTVKEILDEIHYSAKRINKSILEPVVIAMFGGHAKKMADIELFSKIGLVSKTIILTYNQLRTEDIKFNPVDFEDIMNPDITFEESACYDYFYNKTFLFTIFKEPYKPVSGKKVALEECQFQGFVRIAFDEQFVNTEVRTTWETVRSLIWNHELIDVIEYDRKGKPIINPCGTVRSAPNFPKSSEKTVFLRGSSSDSSYKPVVINGIHMTFQNYWIKGTYIVDLLKKAQFL